MLLSSEHQTCLSRFLGKIGFGREHQGLDLNDLPVRKLIQRMSRMPSSKSLLIVYKEHSKSQEGKFIKQKMHRMSSCGIA